MSVQRRIIGEYMRRVEGEEELRCDLCGGDVVVHLAGRVKGTTRAHHLCESCWQSEYERGAICIPSRYPPPRARKTWNPEKIREVLLHVADQELLMYGGMKPDDLERAKQAVRSGIDEERRKHAGDPAAENEAMAVCVKNFLNATISSRCARCGGKAVASFTNAVTKSTERLCDACVKEAMPGAPSA